MICTLPIDWPSPLTIKPLGGHWVVADKDGKIVHQCIRHSTLTDDLRDTGYLPADVQHLTWSRAEPDIHRTLAQETPR